MALKIGITGGIGSGKSTVCKLFELIGIPIFEADSWAKKLTNTHPQIRKELIRLYGKDIYSPTGTIDRKKLASIIFNDQIQLQKVNNLIHPVVRDEFRAWSEMQKTPYVIHEAAILFESGVYKMMDYNILVSAPKTLRVERIVHRDHTTTEQINERMEKQWSDKQKRKLADTEIKNDNTELIIPRVIKIDKQLKEYGKIW